MFAYRIQGPQKRSLTVQAGIGRMVLSTCIVMGGLTMQPGPASSVEIDLRKAESFAHRSCPRPKGTLSSSSWRKPRKGHSFSGTWPMLGLRTPLP